MYKRRNNYKSNENRKCLPAIVFRFVRKKRDYEGEDGPFEIYEKFLKISECILLNANKSLLHGWRLNAEGVYQRIPIENGRIHSEQLDMFMEIRDGNIRFTDAKTGEYLRTPLEAEEERRHEKARADAEAMGRQQLEALAAKMQAEIHALRQKNSDT